MKFFIISVRDRAADVFSRPTFHSSIGAAVRSFGDEVNRADKDNVFYNHPEDFELFELGLFDDQTGTFDTHLPSQVAIGKDLVRKD